MRGAAIDIGDYSVVCAARLVFALYFPAFPKSITGSALENN